jgi:hypothetical protein
MPDVDAQHATAATRSLAVDAHKRRNWSEVERGRTTARVSLRPHADILRRCKVYCAMHSLTLTEFFEMAILNLADVDAHEPRTVGANAPIDKNKNDSDQRKKALLSLSVGAHDAKTFGKVLDLFLSYQAAFDPTGSRFFTPTDCQFCQELIDAGTDLRVIELGILYTQLNKLNGGIACRINSFLYYRDEIKKVESVKQGGQLLDAMIECYRERHHEITGHKIDFAFLDR